MSVRDIRWAVNVLLERVAKKFERWDTHDIWRSEAAAVVRGFKHDLGGSVTMQDDQPKAEQAGSPWAKTIGLPFGEELVRRWNAYEFLVNTCARLADDNHRLQAEQQNCPPASESEYVRRLEDEVALWKERTQEGGRIIDANVNRIEELEYALAIMWHSYEGGHRPPAKVVQIAKECYERGKPEKQ